MVEKAIQCLFSVLGLMEICVADDVLPECRAARAVFYCPKDESILMMHNPEVDLYFTIGGTVQDREQDSETLIREVKEETGHHLSETPERPVWYYEKVVQRKKDGSAYWCLNKNFFYYIQEKKPFTVGTQGFDMQEKKDRCTVQWMSFEELSKIDAAKISPPEFVERLRKITRQPLPTEPCLIPAHYTEREKEQIQSAGIILPPSQGTP
ncbi:NUDIX domain-containing protein [Candidatus Hepatobacter penaei]|uniref:NUDIX domain-containing protein n=1 Tax=Candidatus Hepatobacter penaei TaxID=1274402 RepID=UPI0012E06719|nr:NUDIX hydrolase [Candidatus Hepatobacter penaei]